jgi:hypothetical protein
MPPKRTDIQEVMTDWLRAFTFHVAVLREARGLKDAPDYTKDIEHEIVKQALQASEATLGKVRYP